MKDFREEAEKRYPDLPYTPKNDEPMYSPHSARLFEQDRFVEGAEHGYSEAMKEHREFYLQVRQFYRLVHQIGLRTFETDEQARLYIDSTTSIEKHLAAFTDHEQSELPFKD
jgi:hypothetical protein